MPDNKDIAKQSLARAYNGRATTPDPVDQGRNGHYRTGGGIVFPKSAAQLAEEKQARAAAEAAREREQQQRKAREELAALRLEKQGAWLDAGGSVETFRQAWPQILEKHLMAKIGAE
jgi:hypothetical protein